MRKPTKISRKQPFCSNVFQPSCCEHVQELILTNISRVQHSLYPEVLNVIHLRHPTFKISISNASVNPSDSTGEGATPPRCLVNGQVVRHGWPLQPHKQPAEPGEVDLIGQRFQPAKSWPNMSKQCHRVYLNKATIDWACIYWEHSSDSRYNSWNCSGSVLINSTL